MICESTIYKEGSYHGVKISDILRFKRGSPFVWHSILRGYEKGRKYRVSTPGGHKNYIKDRIKQETTEYCCTVWG